MARTGREYLFGPPESVFEHAEYLLAAAHGYLQHDNSSLIHILLMVQMYAPVEHVHFGYFEIILAGIYITLNLNDLICQVIAI